MWGEAEAVCLEVGVDAVGQGDLDLEGAAQRAAAQRVNSRGGSRAVAAVILDGKEAHDVFQVESVVAKQSDAVGHSRIQKSF